MSVLASVTRVKWTKVACFKMVAHRVNMCYSAMETVELVLNEGSDAEDFSDSGSEENIVDSWRGVCASRSRGGLERQR